MSNEVNSKKRIGMWLREKTLDHTFGAIFSWLIGKSLRILAPVLLVVIGCDQPAPQPPNLMPVPPVVVKPEPVVVAQPEALIGVSPKRADANFD